MRNLLNFLLKYNYWLLFILLEVVSFTLLFRFNNYQGSVWFTSANVFTGSICEMAGNVSSYFGLRDENRELMVRNVQLELELERLKERVFRYEKDSLQMQFGQEQDEIDSKQVVPARVVNNTVNRIDNYITIDKGEADGVFTEMGVLSGTGVVGIVYRTSAHYAVVLPILNSKSSISCKIKRTDYFGTLKWNGGSSDIAWLKDIPRHSEFSLGDTVVTSGHSAIFPENIPIGVVDDMEDSRDGLTYLLKVHLFTDFARLHDVGVVGYYNGTEQVELENSIK